MKIIALSSLALIPALGAACHSSDSVCLDEPGTACTYAGTAVQGKSDDVRDRRESLLNWPTDIAFGADDRGYIVDWNNHEVRRIEADDTLTIVMGNSVEAEGAPDGTDFLPPSSPIGAPGTIISLNHPTSLDVLPDGRLVVASWHGLRLRVYDPESGVAHVIAGNGQYGNTGDGGAACHAEMNLPRSVAADATGRLYVLDQKNQRIRTLDSADPNATIANFAGNGMPGFTGDGAAATAAQLWFITKSSLPSGGLATDGGHLYVSDNGNNRIRRIDLATHVIDTIAGNGAVGYTGDGEAALSASLNSPADLAIGPDGRLWVSDSYNNVIRRIDLTTGVIDTIVGTGDHCDIGATCLETREGLPAREVVLNGPLGIGFDHGGNLYIADTYNNRVVRITRDW